jgi:type I restriction enzyme S subunit
VSVLPAGWIELQLGEVGSLIRGVSYKKEQSAEAPNAGLIPVLRATNITGSSLTFENLVYVPADNISSDQLLQTGDVVIASSSGSKEIVGKAGAFSREGFVGSFGAFCTGIRPSPQLVPKYFGYYFQTPSYRKAVSELSAGSNINNLKSGDLAAQPFPLPPKQEQTRIVAKLEELLSELDAGVAELKAAQKKLQQYRRSLLKAAVEGALTADWREAQRQQSTPIENGSQLLARILTERRAIWEAKQLARFKEQGRSPPTNWKEKYCEPAKPDFDGLANLPVGWTWASIEQITENFDGSRVPVRSTDRAARSGRFPYYGASGIIDHVDNYLFDGDFLLISEDGANLLARATPIAFKASGKFWVNNHAHIVQTLSGIPLDYLAIYLNSISIQFWVTGSAQPKLTQAALSKIPVPLPPMVEQERIALLIAKQQSAIEKQKNDIAYSLQQSKAQRQNVLRAAFAGELVPPQPNDGSANVLLERIRVERASRAGHRRRAKSRNLARPE